MEEKELPYSVNVEKELDEIAESVMPQSWKGHGRLEVFRSEELSVNQKIKGVKAINKFAEQKPELMGKQLAEAVIPHVKTRFD